MNTNKPYSANDYSSVKIFIYRCVGLLGCLLFAGITARFFFIREYVWAWIYTPILVFIIYNYIRDFFRPKPRYVAYYNIMIAMVCLYWHEYTTYKRDLRAEKYGVTYNRTRERLKIPAIPADWHIKFKGYRTVEWQAPKGAQGHESKFIVLDSTYKMDYERDEYNFKGIHDTSRSISILYEYATRKSKDSIFYTYTTKDTSIKISRHQADSIFEMAKIRKDY